MESNHHIKKYINYHKEYVKKYGENTVVLMQSGSHFNLFSVINDDINEGPDIYHICQNILNNSLQVTKQNKKKPEISYSNCLLAGFPVYSIEKYQNMFLNNNYTVVIVEQTTPPPNPERGVTRILSPGTTILDYNSQDTRYLMSIFIEKNTYKNKDLYITALSTIDLSTGKNYLHDIESSVNDNGIWIDEIGRYIHFYNPMEIIIQVEGFEMTTEEVIQKWDIPHNSIQMNHYNEKEYENVTYQNDFLEKIFNLDIMITPLEHFDLSMKPHLSISYIYMLQYIHDHLVDTLDNIEVPEYVNDRKCLCLTSNSIRQLNVINNYSYFKGKNESLLSICNLCVTTMGRRLFKDRLLYPSVDREIIEKRYDYIDIFRSGHRYETIHNELKKVGDLEKSLRKMGLGLLQRGDFYSDTLSFEYVSNFVETMKDNFSDTYDIKLCSPYIEFYKECKCLFQFHNLTQFGNLERSILVYGINFELDKYDEDTMKYHSHLLSIGNRLSQLLDGSENSIKLENDERNNWFFYCTNKRAITFKERLNNLNDNRIHVKESKEGKNIYSFRGSDFRYKKKDGSSTIIQFDICDNLSNELMRVQDRIKKMNTEEWQKKMKYLFNKYNDGLKDFYYFLSEIDCYCAGAKLSIMNGYNRPTIVDSKKSFVDCKGIRHPIVEKIHIDTEYIKNDLCIGRGGTDGILLFGTNACGKSTFMKAIGLNIILAQSGLFVAADDFQYYPYTQIFTRILNNDNIFRSQSSFAVEIQELKSILNRSNHMSLILGDELCSGTETTSALCIIAAGLESMCRRQSTFIFTSHLHELTKLEEVNSLDNLKIYHLKIDYDNDKGENVLIYDRRLSDGPGPSIYGLKVCEAMGLPCDFISYAKGIKNRIDGNGMGVIKKSQYNSKIYMDECKICLSKHIDLETHHIKDQQYADADNIIDHHHKNIKHNLVQLCKACHLRVTVGEIDIIGWKETSVGKKLDWNECVKKANTKKMFDTGVVKQVYEMRKEQSTLSNGDFLKKIEIESGIKMSVSTLRKIMNNDY